MHAMCVDLYFIQKSARLDEDLRLKEAQSEARRRRLEGPFRESPLN